MHETYQTKNGIYFTVRMGMACRDPELLSIEIVNENGKRIKHFLLDIANSRLIYGGA